MLKEYLTHYGGEMDDKSSNVVIVDDDNSASTIGSVPLDQTDKKATEPTASDGDSDWNWELYNKILKI